MDNQHRHIKGYRDLSAAELSVMNAVKDHAEATRELIGQIHALNAKRFGSGSLRQDQSATGHEIDRAESNRWAVLAKTQLQQGFMALTRAVALPTTF